MRSLNYVSKFVTKNSAICLSKGFLQSAVSCIRHLHFSFLGIQYHTTNGVYGHCRLALHEPCIRRGILVYASHFREYYFMLLFSCRVIRNRRNEW